MEESFSLGKWKNQEMNDGESCTRAWMNSVLLNCTVKYGWVSEWVKVTQVCLTLCNPMDYTVHGILQARKLEWVVFPVSRGSSQPRDRTQVSHIAGGFFSIKHYDTFTTRTQKRMCNANCWLKDHHIVPQFHNLDHFPKALFQSSNLPAKSTISFNLFLLNKYRIL